MLTGHHHNQENQLFLHEASGNPFKFWQLLFLAVMKTSATDQIGQQLGLHITQTHFAVSSSTNHVLLHANTDIYTIAHKQANLAFYW